MNMTVPFRPLTVRPHLREAEIVCLPRPVSMNNPKRQDRTVPTFEAPRVVPVKRTAGRPRSRPVQTPKEPTVRLVDLILAEGDRPSREVADKLGIDISYVRKVHRKNGRPASRPAPVARPDSFYLDKLQEHEAGTSRKALMEKYGMNDKQLSYCLIKARALREKE